MSALQCGRLSFLNIKKKYTSFSKKISIINKSKNKIVLKL